MKVADALHVGAHHFAAMLSHAAVSHAGLMSASGGNRTFVIYPVRLWTWPNTIGIFRDVTITHLLTISD